MYIALLELIGQLTLLDLVDTRLQLDTLHKRACLGTELNTALNLLLDLSDVIAFNNTRLAEPMESTAKS